MAKKDRLNNIEDPTFAIISATVANKGGSSTAKKSADNKPAKKASAKENVVPVKTEEKSTASETIPVPTLLKRPERERLTKKFMILLPESLYIKLFNASVEDDKSLNKYILDVLREHADKKGL